MYALERSPNSSLSHEQERADASYRDSLEAGFIPRAVVVCPDQLLHPSEQDAAYAAEFSRLVVKLAHERGAGYVKFQALPTGFEVIDQNYHWREHRLVMERLLPAEEWQLKNSVSSGPKSVGEALATQE